MRGDMVGMYDPQSANTARMLYLSLLPGAQPSYFTMPATKPFSLMKV